MKNLVSIALLLLGILAAGVACAPGTEGVPVTKGVVLIEESVDIDDPDEPTRPLPTPLNTLAPEEIPEGVSPALAMDAQYYAESYGVELSEAIRRLTLQEPMGRLGATLESNEAGTLGGVWIQHEPEFRLVAAFTKDGEKTMAKYVQDGPMLDLIEVRTVDATLRQLKTSPTESWLDSQRTWVSSGIRHQRIREPSRDIRAGSCTGRRGLGKEWERRFRSMSEFLARDS